MVELGRLAEVTPQCTRDVRIAVLLSGLTSFSPSALLGMTTHGLLSFIFCDSLLRVLA